MQTHCPHCETRFRVTETQVAVADGLVRCGVCEEVFNFYEITAQTPQDTEQQPILHTGNPDAYTDNHTEDRTDEPTGDHWEEHSPDITAENEYVQLQSDVTDERDETFSAFEDQSGEDPSNKVRPDEIRSDHGPDDFAEESLPDDSERDAYNFFEDNDEDSREHVVPEEFRDSYLSDTHSIAATVLWSIGILLLTATLFVEYAWFNRNEYAQIPEIQAEIEKLCQQFDCKNLSLRAPSEIELVTRNIYSHPNEKDVLLVDVTMKNNAAFSQPYPIMKINFSDIRGGAVASRNFLPREYLSADYLKNGDKPRLLPPDTSSSVTLEIQDPGKLAMTYEFNFL